jgi:hypothetical protein
LAAGRSCPRDGWESASKKQRNIKQTSTTVEHAAIPGLEILEKPFTAGSDGELMRLPSSLTFS